MPPRNAMRPGHFVEISMQVETRRCAAQVRRRCHKRYIGNSGVKKGCLNLLRKQY